MSYHPQRVKAVIAYDGSAYVGFQKQSHTPKTITQEIEKALLTLHIQTNIVGSGRTDAGVHAANQVIHFDLPEYWKDLKKLQFNLNRILRHIQFKHITYVHHEFHARFSAKKRLYRYVFKSKKPSIFEQRYISHYDVFDQKLLHIGLKKFEGLHDFDFLRKTGTDTRSSTREVYQAKYIQRGDYHFIYFQANGFLRAQVRMMIHLAMLYAKGELSITQLQEQLDCQKRYTTNLAPPEGLYLARVIY